MRRNNNNDVFIVSYFSRQDFIQTFTCVGRSNGNEIIIEIYISHFFPSFLSTYFLNVIKINKPARCTAKNSRHKQILMKTPSTFITLESHATHFMVLFRFLCSTTTDDFDVAVIKVRKCVYNFTSLLFL